MATLILATPLFATINPSRSQNSTLHLTTTMSSGATSHEPTSVASFSLPTGSGCRRNGTRIYTVPEPRVTPPPAGGGVFFEPGSESSVAGVEAKFRQTTYYTCVTWPTTVHCGWHEPILDASMDAAWAQYDSRRAAAWAVLISATVLALLLSS